MLWDPSRLEVVLEMGLFHLPGRVGFWSDVCIGCEVGVSFPVFWGIQRCLLSETVTPCPWMLAAEEGECCWLWTAAHTELYTLCVWSLGPCQRLPGALLRCWARGPLNVSPASPTPATSFGPQFAICKCLEDLQGHPEIHVVWVDQTVKDVGWSKNGTWYFLLWFCSEAIFSVVEQKVEVLEVLGGEEWPGLSHAPERGLSIWLEIVTVPPCLSQWLVTCNYFTSPLALGRAGF